MKYSLLGLLLVLVLAFSDKCLDKDSTELALKISLVKDYFVPFEGKLHYVPTNKIVNEKRFDIKLSIINLSNKTISFWIKTCSWEENFLINTSYIDFVLHDCNHNFPHIATIKAKDSLSLKTTLKRTIGFDNPCENCIGMPTQWTVEDTKVGIILIESAKCKDHDEYERYMGDKSRWDKIIWSNGLQLNK
jgi:hypothetical protein